MYVDARRTIPRTNAETPLPVPEHNKQCLERRLYPSTNVYMVYTHIHVLAQFGGPNAQIQLESLMQEK